MTRRSRQSFWTSKRPMARMKHAILSDYANGWAAKLLSWNESVSYVDCFAGPGRYANGAEGSPIVALRLAEKWPERFKPILVEKRKDDAESLRAVVASFGMNHPVMRGRIEDCLDEVLALTEGRPLLMFLDPFGAALPRGRLEDILNRAERTEVILNFSVPYVSRHGGYLYADANYSRRLGMVDIQLGGEWWRDSFKAAFTDTGDMTEAALVVARMYRESTATATQHLQMAVPLRRATTHKPLFEMTVFANHAAAFPLFYDAASRAQEAWLKEILAVDAFEELSDTPFRGHEVALADEQFAVWLDEVERTLTAHLQERLEAGQSWRCDNFDLTFGPTLGSAREKHLRKSWQALALRGIACPTPKGSLWNSVIGPAHPASAGI